MPWTFMCDGMILNTVKDIDALTGAQVKEIHLQLIGDHFDRSEIRGLLEKAKIAKDLRTSKTGHSQIYSVCTKIEDALVIGDFGFELFRQVSGWFHTDDKKTGSDPLENIIRGLFYDHIFERLTERGKNTKPLPEDELKKKFVPWLKEIFLSDQKYRARGTPLPGGGAVRTPGIAGPLSPC